MRACERAPPGCAAGPQVDHADPTHASLLAFNRLWVSQFGADSLLVFSTGRSPELFHALAVSCWVGGRVGGWVGGQAGQGSSARKDSKEGGRRERSTSGRIQCWQSREPAARHRARPPNLNPRIRARHAPLVTRLRSRC